jgi:glycosyltransferase involved in cell wall biosynthesis
MPPDRARVVHIGTADNSGGAARASFRIHEGLKRAGVESRMLCGYVVERGRPDIASLPEQKTLGQRAFRLAVNKIEQWSGLEYRLLPWKNRFLEHPFVAASNIVHLHNLHGGFFAPEVLPQLAHSRTVVWSIHDMWPLTGHCYYPDMYGCVRWKTGCGRCPGLRQDEHYPLLIDTTARLWNRKRAIYSHTDMTLVAQSRWTMEQIRNSPLLSSKRVAFIPYGVDVEAFRPMDKATARDRLKIPRDAKALFFSAVGLDSPRKGWPWLREALSRVRSAMPGPLVMVVAGHLDKSAAFSADVPIVNLGYVTEDRTMMLAYNAADLFVGASLLETFGLVFLEAAACGTPSVAFDTSGVRDVVRHMETGYLASFKDAEDFARGTQALLGNDELRAKLGDNCRRMAESQYSTDLQASRYATLYRDLLNARG